MNYAVGMKLQWTPIYWKWDQPAVVEVQRVYRRGEALLSNGQIVDADGYTLEYSVGKTIGRVSELGASVT